MLKLTETQKASYERIVASGEAALARWSPTNPMRPSIERQVADARAQLAVEKTYSFQHSGRDFAAERKLTPEQRAGAMLQRMGNRSAIIRGHVF